MISLACGSCCPEFFFYDTIVPEATNRNRITRSSLSVERFPRARTSLYQIYIYQASLRPHAINQMQLGQENREPKTSRRVERERRWSRHTRNSAVCSPSPGTVVAAASPRANIVVCSHRVLPPLARMPARLYRCLSTPLCVSLCSGEETKEVLYTLGKEASHCSFLGYLVVLQRSNTPCPYVWLISPSSI